MTTTIAPPKGRIAQEILALVTSRGGTTDAEIEELTGFSHQTVSSTRRGLVQKGYVKPSGRRRKGAGRRTAAIVWVKGEATPEQRGFKPEPETEIVTPFDRAATEVIETARTMMSDDPIVRRFLAESRDRLCLLAAAALRAYSLKGE